jgi:hypothetical protein
MNRDSQLFSIVENNFMQFSSVAIEIRSCWVPRRRLLVDDNLPGVPFVDVETVRPQVDRDRAHFLRYLAIGPTVEDPSSIGPKCDNITQYLEFRERFVYNWGVALTFALYGCCEASKTCIETYE